MALSIRLRNEREASDLIDLALERSVYAGGARGLNAAAASHYGVPIEGLTSAEALAPVVTMRFPAVSPQCPPERFAQWYAHAARRTGLDASAAGAMRRLRPMACD